MTHTEMIINVLLELPHKLFVKQTFFFLQIPRQCKCVFSVALLNNGLPAVFLFSSFVCFADPRQQNDGAELSHHLWAEPFAQNQEPG